MATQKRGDHDEQQREHRKAGKRAKKQHQGCGACSTCIGAKCPNYGD